MGSSTRIDEKKPVTSDVSHCRVFTSPNSMPRTMMKNIDTPANAADTA